MADDNSTAFWDIVSEHDPTVFEKLEVGDWVYVERTRAGSAVSKHFAIVKRKWIDDQSNPMLQFRDPTDSDTPPAEVTTTIIGVIK